MNEDQRLQARSKVLDVLQLIMALKDAYNDVNRRHNRGDNVRRRVTQLQSNLKACLQADRSAADDPEGFENSPEEESPDRQLDLFDQDG